MHRKHLNSFTAEKDSYYTLTEADCLLSFLEANYYGKKNTLTGRSSRSLSLSSKNIALQFEKSNIWCISKLIAFSEEESLKNHHASCTVCTYTTYWEAVC